MNRLLKRALAALVIAVVPVGLLSTHAYAIRGGVPVDVGDYPWAAVSTRPGSAHPYKESCGGVLLAPTIFMTAGHCTMKVETWDVRTVIVGRTDMATSVGVEVKPVDAWLHPEYSQCNEGFQCGDIGIWVLEKPVGTAYLEIADAADEQVGTDSTMISWGQLGGGQNSTVARKGIFPLATEQPCKDKGYDFKTGKILCFGPVNGEYGTCIGDSGSGYTVGNKLLAIHSGGDSNCQGPQFGIKVSDQKANIQKIIDGQGDQSGWRHLGPKPAEHDFSVATSPSSGSVSPGGSTTTTVNTAVVKGSPSAISLTASGLPTGVTASFNPATVQPGSASTLTLSAASSASTGTFTVTVKGTSGTVTRTAAYGLTVLGDAPPDFTLALDPASGTVAAGQSATSAVKTTALGGTQQVSLSAPNPPAGITVSFSPSTVTSGESSTMTVSVAATVAAGSYPITVQGYGSVARGKQVTYSLTVTSSAGRTYSNGTDYPIRDYERIYSPVTSTASGQAATSVKLSVTITHSCAEDLGISLVAPDGTLYAVKYSGGYACTPISGAKAYTVNNVNEAASGRWQLRVTDYGPGDSGTLDTWSITL